MSATGLEVLDKTVQTTNIWLNEIMAELIPDRQTAWHVLGAVLRPLRDRLSIDQAAHLSAQLPIIVRGVFYDQWHPADEPRRERHLDEFLAHVAAGLEQARPVNARDATRTVFGVLARHVSPGEVRKLRDTLPAEIRTLWPENGGARPAA
jgi:uncharacterized protein (DUF2267 family)